MIRPQVKRTNSEPSSIALQVERERYMGEQNRTNRSHGDLNTVDHKSWSAGIPNEIPSQFAKVTSGASGTSGDSCSTSSSTSSPPSSPLRGTTASASLSAQEELDQFPDSHFSFTGLYAIFFLVLPNCFIYQLWSTNSNAMNLGHEVLNNRDSWWLSPCLKHVQSVCYVHAQGAKKFNFPACPSGKL